MVLLRRSVPCQSRDADRELVHRLLAAEVDVRLDTLRIPLAVVGIMLVENGDTVAAHAHE
jgi:hypothetical protein